MLSLTRSIVLRAPLAVLRTTALATLQRPSFAPGLTPYRTFSNTSILFAAATSGRKTVTTKAKTTSRAKPKAKPAAKSRAKPKPKAKVKAKAKAKAKPKRKPKRAAKPKPVSTFVPLAMRPPKRPVSPFLLFTSRTVKRSPGVNIVEQAKAAGSAWSNFTDAEKKPFIEEAKVLRHQYQIARDEWIKDPKNVVILKTLNKDRKKKGKKRIIIQREDRPKPPTTGFMKFMNLVRKDPEISARAPSGRALQPWLAREAASRWNAFPESEKAKFKKEYLAEREKYDKEVKA